jgi:hypothetical protein
LIKILINSEKELFLKDEQHYQEKKRSFYFLFILHMIYKKIYDLGEELFRECFIYLLNYNFIIDQFMNEKLKNLNLDKNSICCETQEFLLELFNEGRCFELLQEDQKFRISIENSK